MHDHRDRTCICTCTLYGCDIYSEPVHMHASTCTDLMVPRLHSALNWFNYWNWFENKITKANYFYTTQSANLLCRHHWFSFALSFSFNRWAECIHSNCHFGCECALPNMFLITFPISNYMLKYMGAQSICSVSLIYNSFLYISISLIFISFSSSFWFPFIYL